MSEKPTILIADDEPGVVAALAREARRAGLSYITDTTSQQVLELAVRHQPAVIILDLKQHVDGRDLMAALKRDPRTRNIKVLVLSAIEDQFTRHVCLELGADDYDVKPFDPSFMSKVARLAGASGERHH
ncbi:MAG TPA: response regulator [Myxococcaceae bacterium]|nr:response regulator [Myxococcaceae bacterium]